MQSERNSLLCQSLGKKFRIWWIIFGCKTNLKMPSQLHNGFIWMVHFNIVLIFFFTTIYYIIWLFWWPLYTFSFLFIKSKNSKIYICCFKLIVDLCIHDNYLFEPKYVVIDFENAIHNACKSIWPDMKMYGCCFHLLQSWYGYVQTVG